MLFAPFTPVMFISIHYGYSRFASQPLVIFTLLILQETCKRVIRTILNLNEITTDTLIPTQLKVKVKAGQEHLKCLYLG